MAESLDLEKMNIDAEALNFMAQGKRHLLVHDYSSAVQFLEEACKLYDSKYGVNADECADAYLKYGCALLELHRQETGALDGLADKPQTDNEDEEEDEEIEDEEIEADESKLDETIEQTKDKENGKEEDISVSPTPIDTEANVTESNGVESTTSTDEISKTTNGNSNGSVVEPTEGPSSSTANEMETDVDPNQPSTSTGITDENRVEDEEDDDSARSNIEVAFEVLTMAKNIYKRQIEYRDDANLKLAETQQKLGEILYEWENNQAALEELEECLEIRKRHLPDDDRLISEAYYHIGLTYSLNSMVEEANSNFQKAIDVIAARLNKLKNSYSDELDAERKEKIESEIKELEFLLPEMQGKIEDNQDQMSTNKLAAVIEETEKLEEEKIAEKKKQIMDKPISNVSHLVKRKREIEEPVDLDSNKKLKNGNDENGHSVEMNE